METTWSVADPVRLDANSCKCMHPKTCAGTGRHGTFLRAVAGGMSSVSQAKEEAGSLDV